MLVTSGFVCRTTGKVVGGGTTVDALWLLASVAGAPVTGTAFCGVPVVMFSRAGRSQNAIVSIIATATKMEITNRSLI